MWNSYGFLKPDIPIKPVIFFYLLITQSRKKNQSERKIPHVTSFNISFINVANVWHALGERAWSYQLFLRHMPQVWTQIIRAVPNLHWCQIQMAVGMFFYRYRIKFSSSCLPCHSPIPSSSGAAQPLLLQSVVSTKGLRRQKHWVCMLHMAWILWVVPWRAWVSPDGSGCWLKPHVKP